MITQKSLEKALLKKGRAKRNRLKWRDGSTLEVSKISGQKILVKHDSWDGHIRPPIIYHFDVAGNLRLTTFKVRWRALFLYCFIPIGVAMVGVWIDTRSVENLQIFWWIGPGFLIFALFVQFVASLRTKQIVRKAIAKNP
ncbi:MAG: hypothetical protein Sapg2KO_10980 [Saprospiraceae bacterium]